MATNYIRKRPSIQNEKNGSQDKALWDSTSWKRRRWFYFIYSYYLCPTLQVGTKGQSKITNTKNVLEASQKDVMIDSVDGRRVGMEIEPESEAVRWSLKMRIVLVLCFGRYADWMVCQRLFWSRWQRNWSRTIFSVGLDTKDRFEAGLKFLSTLGHLWLLS